MFNKSIILQRELIIRLDSSVPT